MFVISYVHWRFCHMIWFVSVEEKSAGHFFSFHFIKIAILLK